MDIDYNFAINEVDTETNTMMVTYTSEGLDDVTVGTRLPFEGEGLELCIKRHAPFTIWEMNSSNFESVSVGASGSINRDASDESGEETLETVKQAKLEEIKDERLDRMDGEVLSGGVSFRAGHATLGTLRAIKESMIAGLYSTVNFKATNGQFYVLDQDAVESAIGAVSLDIQDAFNQERTKVGEVNALTTIEQVKAYTI